MKQVIKDGTAIIATDNEIEIVQAFANDATRQEVALLLAIPIRTLDSRLQRMRLKYGLKSLYALIQIFFRNQLIS